MISSAYLVHSVLLSDSRTGLSSWQDFSLRSLRRILKQFISRWLRFLEDNAADLLHPLREQGRPARVAEEAMRKVAGRPLHVVCRAHEEMVAAGSRLRGSRVLVVGASYKPGVADCRQAPALEIIERLQDEGASVDFHDPHVSEVVIDGVAMSSVDPDPRRDASGLGPEDYDLVIVVTVHPGHDYGWLARCPAVLDCTYRTPGGRRRLVP